MFLSTEIFISSKSISKRNQLRINYDSDCYEIKNSDNMNKNNEILMEEMKQIINDIEEKLQDLKNIVGGEVSEKKQKYLRRINVIQTIDEEGGVVNQERYYQILEDAGLSRQGGSGFMVGERSSLTYIAGDRVAVTKHGREKIKKWERKADRY